MTLEEVQKSNAQWYREAIKQIADQNTSRQVDVQAGYWTARVMDACSRREIDRVHEMRLLKKITDLQEKRYSQLTKEKALA